MTSKPFLTAALLLGLAAPVAAKPPLAEVTEIREGLITVGIAYELSEVCDSVQARTVRGLFTLNGLKNRAKALGYSRDEIDAYVNDRTEKARLERVARSRLQAMGAPRGNVAAHCAVARAEIAKGSAIGRLLRD